MSRIIKVKVNTRAHHEKMEEIDLDTYTIWVTAAPTDNEANNAVIEVLADYFNISPSNIKITSGWKSRHKFIEIEDS